MVTAIVTAVRERQPEYIRDEDGNSPSELIGVDGWWFRILVRPATCEEAAGILVQEEKAARRASLERRRRDLFRLVGGTRRAGSAWQRAGRLRREGVAFDPSALAGRRAARG
ncbi:hypothetical protein PUR49_32440 [Streptomyces sp. BE147]|uniref:hypothetical protein n=1 Tax=Streptomyces sp. BE147 TaxID=3002524 RepID=UPI002E7775E6|nr:hypothetical protein [Streptomyces sp. BE147]MEE1741182.1 hypothetical protein [Streptomyces sp. BE147]